MALFGNKTKLRETDKFTKSYWGKVPKFKI